MIKYILNIQTLIIPKQNNIGGKMSFINVLFTAIALSMDAMSLALCHGVCAQNNKNNLLKLSSTFGFFQFSMAFVGFSLGSLFLHKLSAYFKYLSFFIFLFLGLMMIREVMKKEEEKLECSDRNLRIFPLILMGIATSVDSLLVGFTFSLLPKLKVLLYCIEIGLVTFLLSGFGFILGDKFGNILGKGANIVGGLLLIFISINILI